MNACKRNSTALLSLLPEACPGDLMQAPDRHAQSPASASKARAHSCPAWPASEKQLAGLCKRLRSHSSACSTTQMH